MGVTQTNMFCGYLCCINEVKRMLPNLFAETKSFLRDVRCQFYANMQSYSTYRERPRIKATDVLCALQLLQKLQTR